jgi:hypothetical protein
MDRTTSPQRENRHTPYSSPARGESSLALEKLTGVNMTKMLPVPNIDNEKFPHTRPWQSRGEHAKLYTFSPTDYNNLGGIWSGTAD